MNIYMDKIDPDFLQTQKLQLLIWLCNVNDIFFIWTHGKNLLNKFMKKHNQFLPNLKFTQETFEEKEKIAFLELSVSLKNYISSQTYKLKALIVINYALQFLKP